MCGWHVGHAQLNLNGPNKAESGQQHTTHLSQCKGANPLIYIKKRNRVVTERVRDTEIQDENGGEMKIKGFLSFILEEIQEFIDLKS